MAKSSRQPESRRSRPSDAKGGPRYADAALVVAHSEIAGLAEAQEAAMKQAAMDTLGKPVDVQRKAIAAAAERVAKEYEDAVEAHRLENDPNYRGRDGKARRRKTDAEG